MKLLMTRCINGVELDCYVERTHEHDGDFWLTREQIGRALEYAEPMKAIAKIHERNAERLDRFSTIVKLTTVEGGREVTREVIVYSFRGLLEICRYSNQPKADAVMDKLYSIADEIRRTGSYNARDEKLKLRRANQIHKLLHDKNARLTYEAQCELTAEMLTLLTGKVFDPATVLAYSKSGAHDNVLDFMREHIEDYAQRARIPAREVREDYLAWCEAHGYEAIENRSLFGRRVRECAQKLHAGFKNKPYRHNIMRVYQFTM